MNKISNIQKKGKPNDIDGKKDPKKFGDKRNEPFKFQYRNKTPLALERISEGKSDEENDDDEFSRNKSSSAKKEKSKLDLGLKVDDVRKINLALPKKEKFENKNEKEKKSNKKNNNEVNNIKVKNNEIKIDKEKKEEESDKIFHSDLEIDEKLNKENTSTEVKPKNINKINNEKKEKEEQRMDGKFK